MITINNKVNELINNNENGIQQIINNFGDILLEIKSPTIYPYLAYAMNLSANYINTSYSNKSVLCKTWAIINVKDLYLMDMIIFDKDIETSIDRFIKYWDDEYEGFLNEYSIYSDYSIGELFNRLYLRKMTTN